MGIRVTCNSSWWGRWHSVQLERMQWPQISCVPDIPVSGSLVVSALSRAGETLIYSGRRTEVSPSSPGRVGGTGRRDVRWAGGRWALQPWVTHSSGKGLRPFMHIVFISCKGLQKKVEGQNVLSQGRERGHSRAVPSEPWRSYPLCCSH